ncbi:Fe-Mn family superoxide dismutase [Achromobacter sp. NFACC18-2]|uniref:Fe-Mn family superoxide dismutase n=1 Tax=Achromobacter sp. NFACC18-2 TaxID=1564112 RepID=UPI0008D50ACF|nr:Fe-Mn family superoxide dismutase [Achromobacter sp. NFACC18-2]SEI46860.1 superoxide dismutase, Fe-Mn family [Achromobacter sp. NFACC18-2]
MNALTKPQARDPVQVPGRSATPLRSDAARNYLGGDGVIPQGGLSVALERDFGSVDGWRADFKALALSQGGEAGWATLSWSRREARLINHWTYDPAQMPAGATILLALEMSDRAFLDGFGGQASAYVDACLAQVRWESIAPEYARLIEIASAPLGVSPSEAEGQAGTPIIDVRRRAVFDNAQDKIPGAQWRDPALAGQWQSDIARGLPAIVYCVHGHEVSQSVALALRAHGVEAFYLAGGIEGWRHAGLPMG